MSASIQEQADAAIDSYHDVQPSDIDSKQVPLGSRLYKIIGYHEDPINGFHATAYKGLAPPHNIIIAYRGTDPDFKHHLGTAINDVAVDYGMVRDQVNPQMDDARTFTQEMLDKAQKLGIPQEQVTVAGHSLGGTIAEAMASEFHLHGTTLNAYGAVGVVPGVPEGGAQVTNYVLGGDPVSAANHHFGTVVPLVTDDDLARLRQWRYLDAPPGAEPPNTLLAMNGADHSSAHFTGPDSLLSPANMAHAQANYASHRAAVDRFRNDVYAERGDLAEALSQMQNHYERPGLPPAIHRQVNEALTVMADAPIRNAVERNSVVQGAEHTLQQGAQVARAGGEYVQTQSEHLASAAREAGVFALPLSPAAPLAGMVAGEVEHWQGQAAAATGHFVGDQLQSAQGAVAQRAHDVAHAAVHAIHSEGFQANAINTVNHVVNAVDHVQGMRQAVAHDVEAVEHAAGQAYDTLAHPERLFHHDAASPQPTRPEASTPALTPLLDPPALRDFRHPDHPLHARYHMFRDALGEQGFHQDRPTLNAVPDVRHYSPEQKDRLAAGFTAQVGTDARFNSEVQQFRKNGDALLAIEHPRRLGDTPLVLAVPEAASLAKTPEEHAAAWRARELPEQHPVNTQRPDPQSLSPDHFAHPANPHHVLFEHARHALTSEYARWGMQKDAGQIDRETVQVMTAARHGQLLDVGAVRFTKMPEASGLGEHPNMAVYESPKGPQQGLSAMVCFVKGQTLQQAPPLQQAAQQFYVVDQQATQQTVANQQWLAQVNAQAQQGQALGR